MEKRGCMQLPPEGGEANYEKAINIPMTQKPCQREQKATSRRGACKAKLAGTQQRRHKGRRSAARLRAPNPRLKSSRRTREQATRNHY